MEEDAVKANELLLWLSARVQGSWEQFKGGVEELHLPDDQPGESAASEEDVRQQGLPIHQVLRLMLERLGHVEFFAAGCENGWRVAPPVWACFETEGNCTAVLCGARTLPLLQRVRTAVSTPAPLEIEDDADAPSIFRLRVPTSRGLLAAIAATGIAVQWDTPRAIMCAAAYSARMTEAIIELPLGRKWVVEQFSADRLRWVTSSREEACNTRDGLFRFRLPYERRYFLRRRGRTYDTDGAAGKYALLRRYRCRVLDYVPESRRLVLPAICRPPLLIERALVLCSGRLPVFDKSNATLAYGCVSRDIARLSARLLDQEIPA